MATVPTAILTTDQVYLGEKRLIAVEESCLELRKSSTNHEQRLVQLEANDVAGEQTATKTQGLFQQQQLAQQAISRMQTQQFEQQQQLGEQQQQLGEQQQQLGEQQQQINELQLQLQLLLKQQQKSPEVHMHIHQGTQQLQPLNHQHQGQNQAQQTPQVAQKSIQHAPYNYSHQAHYPEAHPAPNQPNQSAAQSGFSASYGAPQHIYQRGCGYAAPQQQSQQQSQAGPPTGQPFQGQNGYGQQYTSNYYDDDI